MRRSIRDDINGNDVTTFSRPALKNNQIEFVVLTVEGRLLAHEHQYSVRRLTLPLITFDLLHFQKTNKE